MKGANKRLKEISNKIAHRSKLKHKKNKSVSITSTTLNSPDIDQLPQRKVATRIARKNILIVCVGEKTEPQYFEKFKPSQATIVMAPKPYDPLKQAKWACNKENILKIEYQESRNRGVEFKFNEIWCVFDKDSFNPGEFNNAVLMCGKYGIECAYSNQAFELWFILHFGLLHSGFDRDGYRAKFNGYLKKYKLEYADQKEISQELFDVLYPLIPVAIKNAKKGFDHHQGKNPSEAESSTTVFRLVEALISS